MNEFEKPQQPDLSKETEAIANKTNLPPQPEVRGEFKDPEKQYKYLQDELTHKYQSLEVQFESDIEDINKNIGALRERQRQLQGLNSLLDDPKEGWRYKNDKEKIEKKLLELETALVKISPKKVGIIGFRKKVENTSKTIPIKQQIEQERNLLTELDKSAEEEAGSNKKRLPVIALELNIEESITRDKINLAILSAKAEEENLEKQKEQIKKKFATERDNWPIVGVAPDGRPQIKQVEIKDEVSEKAFELMAYGGTAYMQRARHGIWPSIPDGTLQDLYSLPKGVLCFGAGEKGGKRFLILKERQHAGSRGGYPYTVLLDPGKEVRQKSNFNDAVIIRNILADPVLKNYLFNEPERAFGIRKMLLSRLEQSYLETAAVKDAALQPFIQDTGTEENPAVFGASSMVEPTPEKLAQAIESLSEEERKKFTFLIRGGKVHGKYFGTRNVWDAGR